MTPLDFMIVGAQKCGTTALASFLNEHPQIRMSNPKEVHLFDDPESIGMSRKEIADHYARVFPDASDHVRGEATPIYFYYSEIAERLKDYNPALKVIVLLRDPVARAYSHYRMEFERGNETLSYWRALLAEPLRLRADRDKYEKDSAHRRFSYRDRGCYSTQLLSIYRCFPSQQVLVLNNFHLRHRHDTTMTRVFDFLKVPDRKVATQSIFSRDTDYGDVPVSSWLLRLSYIKERSRLQRLVDFDVKRWTLI